MAVIDAVQIAEMGEWVAACLACEPGTLSPSEILNYTEHNYPGGTTAYLHSAARSWNQPDTTSGA